MNIHPTAIIDKKAEIDPTAKIGAYCVIGPDVSIGKDTVIDHHVVIVGNTSIGQRNRIFSHTTIGSEPQDISYKKEPTRVEIGSDNIIRENVTIHRGTLKDRQITTLGNFNMLMAYCHIAHDCQVDDHVIMANGVQLGGHCRVENYVTFGGIVAVHHFVTIGQQAFIGGLTRVIHDAPPFMTTEGHPSKVKCVNVVGLKRRNVSPASIEALKRAYKLLYRSAYPKATAIDILQEEALYFEELCILLEFLINMESGQNGRTREAIRKSSVVRADDK